MRCPGGRRAGVAALLGLAACGPDAGQVTLCERALFELVGPGEAIAIVDRRADQRAHTVTLVFRTGAEAGAERTLSCRFAGGRLDDGRLELVAVHRDDGEPLSQVSLAFLRRRLGLY